VVVREHLGEPSVRSIVWFSNSAELGGAEFSLVEGAAALVRQNIAVHVVLPGDGPLAPRLRRTGAATTIIPHLHWVAGPSSAAWKARKASRLLRKSLRPVARSVALLRQVRPDVVVTNTLTSPLGAVTAALGRMPHVWYVHEFGVADHGLHFDLGERVSLRTIDALSEIVIVNSGALRSDLQARGIRKPIYVVPYTVEVAEQRRIAFSADGLRLVQLAQLIPGKRQEDAVRAVARLTQTGVDVHLRLVGSEDPRYGSFLRDLVRALKIDERVDIVPFTDDPAGELLAADVALVCSRNEAFGRVTVEAMKLGIPVVGAASGGTVELIRDGWNGLLYQTGNPADLAEKIERLSRDRSRLAILGGNGLRWARETFNERTFADEFLAALSTALARS
jgi:glycosyltransferase involved in cell wall biosynthesis